MKLEGMTPDIHPPILIEASKDKYTPKSHALDRHEGSYFPYPITLQTAKGEQDRGTLSRTLEGQGH